MDNLAIDLTVNDQTANGKIDSFVSKVRVAGNEIDTIGKNSNLGKQISADLDRAIVKVDQLTNAQKAARLNLTRQGADVFTSAAMGMSPAMIAIQQGPQIMDAMATSGIKLSRAMMITAGAVGTIAAAGFLFVKWSQSVREEAERRYKLEERIQGIYNRQALSLKEIADVTQRIQLARNRGLAQLQADEELERAKDSPSKLKVIQDRLGGEIASLAREKYYGGIYAPDKTEDDKKREAARKAALDAEIAKREAEIERIEALRKVASRTGFNDVGGAGGDPIIDRMKKELEEWKENVDKGKDKVKELGQIYSSLADSLFARQGANNPFVALFAEGDQQLKQLRENTRGLSKDIIAQFEAMEAKAAGLRLFETRLDSRLGAFGLRDEASNFRNPFDDVANKKRQDEIINRFLENSPNFEFDGSEEARRNILMRSQLGRNTLETPQDRLNKRLDEQFDLIFDRRQPGFDQGIADRKFNALTQGMNPLELSDRLRDAAASSREREAARMESAESEARKQRDEQIALQKRIAENQERLLEVAQSGGLAGVIKIIDDTGGKVETRLGKRGSQEDVADYYSGN